MHERTPLSCNINFTFVILKLTGTKYLYDAYKNAIAGVFFSNSQPFDSTTDTFIFDESHLYLAF